MREPEAANGWPRAIAPPLTLVLFRSSPASFSTERNWAAKASLTWEGGMEGWREGGREGGREEGREDVYHKLMTLPTKGNSCHNEVCTKKDSWTD